MLNPDKNNLLTTAITAARKAEEVIKKYYQSGFEVRLKKNKTPVTAADTEAEEVIKDTIRRVFPQHSFLGEEYGEDGTNSEFIWLIDPIDATKNFARKLPFFSTEIALMKKGELILGVSNVPLLDRLLYAEKGKGAYLNSERINVSEVAELNKASISFGSLTWFKKINKFDNLIRLSEITRHRAFGDAWTFGLLAQGYIDVVLEAYVNIWDIAAATIIVEEAGGNVTDFAGNPVARNTTSLLATNNKLHGQVLKFFV